MNALWQSELESENRAFPEGDSSAILKDLTGDRDWRELLPTNLRSALAALSSRVTIIFPSLQSPVSVWQLICGVETDQRMQ